MEFININPNSKWPEYTKLIVCRGIAGKRDRKEPRYTIRVWKKNCTFNYVMNIYEGSLTKVIKDFKGEEIC